MICFDRIKRKSLSYPVWYAKLLQIKRAWSASGCPGRPGLSDSQSRSGGVADGWKSVLRFYSSSARKAVYPSYS